jgi:hypothetical protein
VYLDWAASDLVWDAVLSPDQPYTLVPFRLRKSFPDKLRPQTLDDPTAQLVQTRLHGHSQKEQNAGAFQIGTHLLEIKHQRKFNITGRASRAGNNAAACDRWYTCNWVWTGEANSVKQVIRFHPKFQIERFLDRDIL